MAEETDLKADEVNKKVHHDMHLKSVFKRFADRTSMHGCGYIQTSRRLVSKIFWSFLTLLAILVLIVHLYKITDQFTDWPKKTAVSLEFNNLRFPAITICNVNVVKQSAVAKYGSKELQELVKAVNPDTILAKILEDEFSRHNGSTNNDTSIKRRSKRSVSDLYDIEWKQFSSDSDSPSLASFADDELTDQRSALSIMWDIFRFLYMKQTKKEREFAGHDIKDMLLECTFDGITCYASNFTLYQTPTYGNCYTLDYEEMYAKRPGPEGGLYLLLYLQVNEFIEGITNGFGAKLLFTSLELPRYLTMTAYTLLQILKRTFH